MAASYGGHAPPICLVVVCAALISPASAGYLVSPAHESSRAISQPVSSLLPTTETPRERLAPAPSTSTTRHGAMYRQSSDFELNLGRAVDVLRHDYPRLLITPPDLSIYDAERICLVHQGRKRLCGLKKYSKLFDALRFLHSTCMSESQVTHRLVYADAKIRVRWSAALWMRDPALGLTTRPFSKTGEPVLAHLDGVSVYVLDPHSALIVEHRLEHLVLNGDAASEQQLHPFEASLLEQIFGGAPAGLAT